MLSRKVVMKAKEAEHGRHIYAYCNERTNQVLYSLERTLKPSALKQLPDIGANNTPPTLRKDSWRPLFSVELPNTPDGRRQGLEAYKMLREYRMLHETNWEPPMELSMKYNQMRKDQIKETLENRGGSKTEKVHDIMKRKKKNLRKRIIMNQKANSIADLAAVLLEQGDFGHTLRTQRAAEIKKSRHDEVQEMLKRAEEAKDGKVQELWARSQSLLDDIREGRVPGQIIKTRAQRGYIHKEIEKTEFAAAAVEWTRVPEIRRRQEMDYWQEQADAADANLKTLSAKKLRFIRSRRLEGYDIQQIAVAARACGLQPGANELPAEPKLAVAEASKTKPGASHSAQLRNEGGHGSEQTATDTTPSAPADVSEKGVDYLQLLPSFPSKFNPLNMPIEKLKPHDPLRKQIKRMNRPDYTIEGITVRWANPLDAEYASMWPGEVQHERMGVRRHTHPKQITNEPIEDLEVFKAVNWKSQKFAWERNPEQVEEKRDTWAQVQAIRARMGLVDDPEKPARKLIEEKNLSSFVLGRLGAARAAKQVASLPEDIIHQGALDESPADGVQTTSESTTVEPLTTELAARESVQERSTSEQAGDLSAEDEAAIIQEAVAERQVYLEGLVRQWKRGQIKPHVPRPDASLRVDPALTQLPTEAIEQNVRTS